MLQIVWPADEAALAQPLLTSEMWAVVHGDMRRATQVRAVMDFLTEIVAEEADLLEGRRAGEVGRDLMLSSSIRASDACLRLALGPSEWMAHRHLLIAQARSMTRR